MAKNRGKANKKDLVANPKNNDRIHCSDCKMVNPDFKTGMCPESTTFPGHRTVFTICGNCGAIFGAQLMQIEKVVEPEKPKSPIIKTLN